MRQNGYQQPILSRPRSNSANYHITGRNYANELEITNQRLDIAKRLYQVRYCVPGVALHKQIILKTVFVLQNISSGQECATLLLPFTRVIECTIVV